MNLYKSDLEALMFSSLKENKELSVREVVQHIIKINPNIFNGKTPRNSLYSVIYRRERKRIANGMEPLFITKKIRNEIVYYINPQNKEYL
ncbi:hypothetical protein [Atlantibacter sp.]|uniref:hypothetical protein n=1 Tax=Atlantibacter sp. TaxID=1903473 RepID=UPI00289A5ADA|nr:hypothetical protein [Atlantibacter sp.]